MNPRVGILMGSDSDLPVMTPAAALLETFGIAYELEIVSAHRTPERLYRYGETAEERGLQVLVAGAGGAAHLPGMLAALTPLPVIGVPIAATRLAGADALHSVVQMPAGVPVACVAIDGGRNAGLLAAQVLAATDPELRERVRRFRMQQSDKVLEKAARAARSYDPSRVAPSSSDAPTQTASTQCGEPA